MQPSNNINFATVPMKGRMLLGVACSAGAMVFLMLLFSGAFQPNPNAVGQVGLPVMVDNMGRPPVFRPEALSRKHDYPEPVVEYTVDPPRFAPSAKFPTKLRVVITGGAGFIGSQLGVKLHNLGHDVILIDNLMFANRDNLLDPATGRRFGKFVLADVLDPRIAPFFNNVDVVFHFAALSALPVCQSHPRDSMNVNVGGVASVLDASRRGGVGRFIFASTSAVYEANKEDVLTEDLAVNPHLLYSLSKYQAELLVKAMAATNEIDIVILRFFNVYGPHQDFRRASPPFTSYLIRELVNGRTPILHSDGTQKRDYVHVDDLHELAQLVMTHKDAVGQTINVASAKPISVNEILSIVQKHTNTTNIKPVYRSPKRFWDHYPQLFQGKKPIKMSILEKEVTKKTVGSYARAESLVGWKPKISYEEGLATMIDFVMKHSRYKDTGNLKSAWGAVSKEELFAPPPPPQSPAAPADKTAEKDN